MEKEQNGKLLEFFLQVLLSNETVTVQQSDIEDAELSDYNLVPDNFHAAEKVKACLQESDDYIMPGSANNLG